MTEQTITRETVTVPREHIGQLLANHINHYQQRGRLDPEVIPAFRYVVSTVLAQPQDGDTFTLDAEAAWLLQHYSYALLDYRLDECAAESYEHPAVNAELEVMFAVMDQAPATDRRMSDAALAELLDGVSWADAQTVAFDD
jgi:hypothetical protein